MGSMPLRRRNEITVAACAVGIVAAWAGETPYALLAPLSAILLFVRGDATVPLRATLAAGLAVSLVVAVLHSGGAHDPAVAWTAFFAEALCIGAVVDSVSSAPASDEGAQSMRIIESMPACTWSATADGRRTFVSSNTLFYVGEIAKAPGLFHELDNDAWRRIINPDDYERVLAKRADSLRTGAQYDTEYRIRRWDGVYRWVRTFGAASRDDDGRVVGWYGTMIDIEDQKQAESALRVRERELSQVVNLVPSHIWRLTPDGQPIFLNRRMIEYLGSDLANKDAAGADGLQAMIDAVHPDDAAQFTAMLDRSLAYGESFALRHRLRRADGVYRWMSSRAEPVRDDDGHITQWYGLCHDIDDQVRAEEALRLSEWRLRQLIDTVPVMIWSTSPEGTPTYVSRRFTDVTGAGIKDVTGADGKPSLSIIHPGDWAGAAEAVAGSWRTGIPYLAQYRQIRRDGSFRWTESRAAPLRDESGEILQWYGVSVDIHDLVIAQEALRDRERELLQLVDMVPSLLWRLSADGEPVFFSRRMIEYLGLDVADADKAGRDRLSAIVAAVVHPDDAPRLDETLKRSLATGEHFSMRFRLRRADGVYRWVEGRAEPLWGEDGEILQWYGLCHDVDGQMQAEEALRQGERSLRQLVETLPAMLYCATPAGEPTYRSQRLREFLGFELDEKDESGKSRLTVTLDAVIHPDDLPLVKEKYAHSLATGEPYALRHRLRRFDGEWRWVETRAAAMRDANGAIVQWNGVCLEIDDEVRAQEELRVAEETLARAGQASTLAELSASIAHEVNQPLGAVVANAHACQRWLTAEPPNLERALMTAQWIIRDANAAADVVSRIRALFRQTVQPRTCTSLRPVIAEVRRWIADLALKNRVLIETDIDAELPAVSIDQVQIQQVLINLARNAVEAMEGIEGARILTVGARRSGDAVQVEVRDRGRGVQHADRIFDAFFTTKESGLGMGLAISRSIVESHGGRLWVESNEADGSRFIFTLPIEASGSS